MGVSPCISVCTAGLPGVVAVGAVALTNTFPGARQVLSESGRDKVGRSPISAD